MDEQITVTLSVKELRTLLICAELWGQRMKRIKPQLGDDLNQIARSMEAQTGKRLSVIQLLKAK